MPEGHASLGSDKRQDNSVLILMLFVGNSRRVAKPEEYPATFASDSTWAIPRLPGSEPPLVLESPLRASAGRVHGLRVNATLIVVCTSMAWPFNKVGS